MAAPWDGFFIAFQNYEEVFTISWNKMHMPGVD